MIPLSTGTFAWGVIALFLLGVTLETVTDRDDLSRTITFGAWAVFGLFWASMVPYFFFEHRSFIEGILALIALPACLYTGYLLYTGRNSLFILTRAVAIMGLIYLPAETIPIVRQTLIEMTTVHTEWLMSVVGYTPEVEYGGAGYENYRNSFVFPVEGEDTIIRFSIVMACTGLGSIAIFGGLISAARGPIWTKLRALSILVPVIYGLNIIRTTFIGITYGHQKFHYYPDLIISLFNLETQYAVSFIISDRIISQFFALVTLIILGAVAVKLVPQLVVVADDVLYILTRQEYNLAEKYGPNN